MKNTLPGPGEQAIQLISESYKLNKLDIGEDAHLSKKGLNSDIESYDVPGLGHLCIIKTKIVLGLMKMETVVLSTTDKDLPLLTIDQIHGFGKDIQLIELYDDQISFSPDSLLDAFQKIRDRDSMIPDFSKNEDHWYDYILYPCSYAKIGKKVSKRLSRAAHDGIRVYLSRGVSAPACDPAEKKAKVREFADNLIKNGGPAVDTVTKMFGPDTAKRLILQHMYAVENCQERSDFHSYCSYQ